MALLKPEQKELLTEFIRIRRTRAKCELFLEQNKAEVFSILGLVPGGNVTLLDAMLYRADAVSYQYPDEILQRQAILDHDKKVAQTLGSAKRLVKGCVKFEDLRP